MKYRISGQVTISCYTEVEAESEKEALEIAADRPMQMVLSADRMGQSCDDVWCHSGELDGEPTQLVAEQINNVSGEGR